MGYLLKIKIRYGFERKTRVWILQLMRIFVKSLKK